jgi:hypothetical protein
LFHQTEHICQISVISAISAISAGSSSLQNVRVGLEFCLAICPRLSVLVPSFSSISIRGARGESLAKKDVCSTSRGEGMLDKVSVLSSISIPSLLSDISKEFCLAIHCHLSELFAPFSLSPIRAPREECLVTLKDVCLTSRGMPARVSIVSSLSSFRNGSLDRRIDFGPPFERRRCGRDGRLGKVKEICLFIHGLLPIDWSLSSQSIFGRDLN